MFGPTLRRRPHLGALVAQVADLRHRVHESTTTLVGPSVIARAAAIWREFEASPDALAENGGKFLRGLLG